MNQAYGNTRLARKLLWVAGYADAIFLLTVCCATASGVANLLWFLLVLAICNAAVGWYALSTGAVFEMRLERKWKAACGHIGFEGVARSYRNGLYGAYKKGETKVTHPGLCDVRGNSESWTGHVKFFMGQTIEEYNKHADAFALTFSVPFVTFSLSENGLIRVRAGKVPVPEAYNYRPRKAPVPEDDLYARYRALAAQQSSARDRAKSSNNSPTPRRRNNSPSARRRGNVPVRSSTSDEKPQAVPSIPKVYAHTQEAPDLTAELELLKGVPVARDLNGREYCIPIEEQHWLIAGRSGSGKNSWIWALVCGLAPAWRARLVRYWAADPKHIELAIEPGWWYRYADSDEDIVSMLEACVNDMITRARMLQGKTRKFTPSIVTPLNVIVIDELGYLVAYMTDRKLRERAINAISSLLVMGRANGYAVVGAVQDPRKETVGFRDQFQIRIALGLPEQMVDLVLGEGMHDAGALCEQVPLGPAGQGTGYAISETSLKPVCLRPAWYSDEAIRTALIGG